MKIGRCAGAEGFAYQTDQFKFYPEFNRGKPMNATDGTSLRSRFPLGHAALH